MERKNLIYIFADQCRSEYGMYECCQHISAVFSAPGGSAYGEISSELRDVDEL